MSLVVVSETATLYKNKIPLRGEKDLRILSWCCSSSDTSRFRPLFSGLLLLDSSLARFAAIRRDDRVGALIAADFPADLVRAVRVLVATTFAFDGEAAFLAFRIFFLDDCAGFVFLAVVRRCFFDERVLQSDA